MDEKGLSIKYIHERIPGLLADRLQLRRCGPPDENLLWQYIRGEGFSGLQPGFIDRPFERGGRTVALVFDENSDLVAVGVATCSMGDQFCYKIGRNVARGRAMAKLQKAMGQLPLFEAGQLDYAERRQEIWIDA